RHQAGDSLFFSRAGHELPPRRRPNSNRIIEAEARTAVASRSGTTQERSTLFKEILVATATATVNGVDEQAHPYHPAPIFENSPTFRMACRQLELVSEHTDIDKGVLERLR